MKKLTIWLEGEKLAEADECSIPISRAKCEFEKTGYWENQKSNKHMESFDPYKEKPLKDRELGELTMYAVVKEGKVWPIYKADSAAELVEFCLKNPNSEILTKVVAINPNTGKKDFWVRVLKIDISQSVIEIEEFIKSEAVVGIKVKTM